MRVTLLEKATKNVTRPIAKAVGEQLHVRGTEFDHVEIYQPLTIPSESVLIGVLKKQVDN
jgi:hypothetical protein